MLVPRSIGEIQNLIAAGVQESLHLDYKRSAALPADRNDKAKAAIAKDVSAFANADGGVLIYGVEEENHLGARLDGGVSDVAWSRETLENIILSTIAPRVDGVEVLQLPHQSGTSVYVVAVPRGVRGPYQETYTHAYFKRFNFKNVPMEDYEIRDVRSRRDSYPPLVDVELVIREGYWIDIVVTNPGDAIARNVSFSFSPDVPEVTQKNAPNFLTRGLKYFPPGRQHRMTCGFTLDVFNDDTGAYPSEFDVMVQYDDPRTGHRMTDTFVMDVNVFLNTPLIQSPEYELRDKLKDLFEKLTKELASLRTSIDAFGPLIGGTGLDLSITTLRNLLRVREGNDDFERMDASWCTAAAFKELLEVPWSVANNIEHFFRYRARQGGKLADVTGMTPDLLVRFEKHFKVTSG